MEKLNNFVSLYQVHPVVKKGEKNSSQNLDVVMNQALQTEMARTSHSTEKTFDREYDQQLWFEKVQGSTEQKNFRAKMLTGGSISPTKSGLGLTKYSEYCQTLTHGLPSGEGQDDKKYTKLKIAGGDMAYVLQNQYAREGL